MHPARSPMPTGPADMHASSASSSACSSPSIGSAPSGGRREKKQSLKAGQVEGAGDAVDGEVPRPQQRRVGSEAVVVARAHGDDVIERGGEHEIGRRRHAPDQVDAGLGGQRVERPLPVGRPVRRGAQGADPEPVHQHPVLLDRAHAPPAGVVEPAPEERRVDGMGGELVDPPLPLREVRRPRRDVPGVDHQRWAAEPFAELLDRVAAGRRRVERVRARLPRHQPRRRHVLRVADLGDRTGDLVVVAPRVQLHGADRHAAGHQGLHRLGDAGTDRPTGFGAIPVGGPVVRPVRQVRRDRVGVPGPPSPPRPHHITPPLEHLGHPVTLEDAERGREAGRDLVEIPVPAPAKRAVRHGDHLLVRMVQRGQPDVPPADTAQQHPQHRRRMQVGSRVEVEVEPRAGDHRQRELRVGEAEEVRLARDLQRETWRSVARTSRWRSRSAPPSPAAAAVASRRQRTVRRRHRRA